MSKEFRCRKRDNTFKKKIPPTHPLYIKTNEYWGRKSRNPQETGSMEFAEMLQRNNDEGWPYDDEK